MHPPRRPAQRLLSLAGVACMAAASCSTPGKGSLVLAISTDMQTPKDIDVVSIFIATDSVPKLDFLGRVAPDGTVSIPSTLAIVEPDDPNAQVHIRVTAFQQQKARVMRDVVTTVPHQRTALLRIPLSFLDDGSVTGTLPAQFVPRTGGPSDGDTQFDPTDPSMLQASCDFLGKGETSIAGSCAKANVDPSKLADFAPSQVFGDGGTQGMPACFHVDECFSGGTPIDASAITTASDGSCSFPLTPSQKGTSWNCALATTDGTGACVGGNCYVPLESDPGEGFTIQPGKAVVMVPGVCKKLAKGATLYVDKMSCATKLESAPVCEPTRPAEVEAGATAPHDAASDDAMTSSDTSLSGDAPAPSADGSASLDASASGDASARPSPDGGP